MKALHFLIWAAMLLIPRVSAADTLQLDLKTSIELAEQHSWDLQDRRGSREAARYRYSQARARLLPALSTELRYTRLSEVDPAVITLPGANQPPPDGEIDGETDPAQAGASEPQQMTLGDPFSEQYSLRFHLVQPVFVAGARSGLRAADAGIDTAEAGYDRARQDLRLQVEEAYFTVLQAADAEKAAAASVELLRKLAGEVGTLVDVGRVTELEHAEVQSRLGTAASELTERRAGSRIARLSLLRLLGLPAEQSLELVEVLGVDERITTPDVDTLLSGARQDNPELQVARSRARVEEELASAAAGELWPRLSLRASWAWENPNQRYFPPTTEFRSSWDASAVLSWTLWDWGANWYGWKAARVEAAEATRSVHRLEEAAAFQVRRGHENLQSAGERLEAASFALRTSEKALDMAMEMFRLGVLRSSEVLEREADRSRAEAALTRALAQRRLASASLRRITGGTLEPSHPQVKELP